jgi:glutamyl-Q tRNA(Asp) synthetase
LAQYRGRFAPSATGPLHLGSIFAALVSYIHAKHHHGEWLIRIDDLDEKRCKPIYAENILECLDAFGFRSSEAVLFQTHRISEYARAFSALEADGRLYSCDCSRKSLPRGPYPGICRHRIGEALIEDNAVRVDTRGIDLKIHDLFTRTQGIDPPGDFIVKRRDGLFAYQLACAIDEQLDQITHVIRGIDLLESTPMQRFIASRLGYESPTYGHFPVLVGSDGAKLSKQTFATPVDWSQPGRSFSTIARLLLLNDTPSQADNAEIWLEFFLSLDNFIPIITKVSEANTLSI